MSFVTVVIEHKNKDDCPAFCPNMELLGGIVTAVNFTDALAELERVEAELEELDSNTLV